MSAIGIKKILEPHLDRTFDLAGELVRECVYYKTESNAGTGLVGMTAFYAPVTALFAYYQSQDIDGSGVLLGDEKCFIRSRELEGIKNPWNGDYLTENHSGVRREVIAARLDPTGTFWTMQVRKTTGEDWGDLDPAEQSEDWGDLGAATVFDDWQA